MAQHFLLTSKARTLSPIKIARLSDDEAFNLLCEIRWGSKEDVVCPKCGVKHKAYFISTRKQWRCKHCKHTFSVTSGTIFANHKLPIQTYLYAIALFVNAVKGISACQLSRDTNVNYRTAFVLAHKLRKALLEHRDMEKLSGEIDMDGTYVHPAPRKANKKTDRIDYRLKENQSPDKRCIIVAREHYTEQEKEDNQLYRGAKRSQVFIALSETQSSIQGIANNHIEKNSRINTDESNAYGSLIAHYDVRSVNHKNEYRSDEGITNNQAESLFARFKRMYYGQVHKMGNTYLLNYANEIAYREDNRRQSNGTQFNDVLTKCLNTSNENNEWCGYWQRKHVVQERIWQ
ncbi:IS1595 family transposase [Avibacterium sp. 20-126]|uniref:IS1595 family transposase n=1 Tax=Avibacterium sp. 20-126 TaxID=2911524 RepID=UPI00218C01CF|nr:IS1595 family transposase [Avibacterium sp. 20-126]